MNEDKNKVNRMIDEANTPDATDVENVDLFADELEDRFNAKDLSTASTAASIGTCFGSVSTACSMF